MKEKCPHSNCQSQKFSRNGTFYRENDAKKIQRYRCLKCGKGFSSATFNPAYRQKKRTINQNLLLLLASGVSQRRCAQLLRVSRRTIERKFLYLAQISRIQFNQFWLKQEKVDYVQFDDLITIEHSKLKPLSVFITVTGERKILEMKVSRMPSTGHLAKKSYEKYGWREDHRPQGIEEVLEKIKPRLVGAPTFLSDKHPYYPNKVAKIFPHATHKTVKGAKACVVGQGELKRKGSDPLFVVNHTLAMLRANINRLFRRTWCTTKKPKRLEDHLYIYAHFHNTCLI